MEDALVENPAAKDKKSKGDGTISEEKRYAPYWFEDGNSWQKSSISIEEITFSGFADLGSNNSGYYTLQAVLTHKGRSSSSGHYVGWIRIAGNKWVKCDDDTVTPVTEEEILKLSGGGKLLIFLLVFIANTKSYVGDWHCAYVLLYGPRLLEIQDVTEKMQTD